MTAPGVLAQSTGGAHWAWVGARLRPAVGALPSREADRSWLIRRWSTDHGTRWELRYTNTPALSATLLGRVHGRDLDAVTSAAAGLLAVPDTVHAEPFATPEQVRTALQPARPHPAGCYEVRKRLEWAPVVRRDVGRRWCLAVRPLVGDDGAWEPVWAELARLPDPTTIGVLVEPYLVTEPLVGNLRRLAAGYARLGQDDRNPVWNVSRADPFAAEAAPGYADALRRYPGHAYLARVSVQSEGPLDPGFAELVATAAGGAACQVSPGELDAAWRNLAALNRDWLADTYRQGGPAGQLNPTEQVLCELVDATEATAAFRFPYEPAGRSLFTRPAGTSGGRRRTIFVSHVGEDVEHIQKLAAALAERGFDPWLDRAELTGGVRWKSKLAEAIQQADYFLACFSPNVAKAESYMNVELIAAANRLRRMPRDRIWFIPVLLAPCTLPDLPIGPDETVADLQCVDFSIGWEPALRQLLRALNAA